MGIPLPYDTRQKDNREPTALLEALLFLSGDAMTEADISAHLAGRWKTSEKSLSACSMYWRISDEAFGLSAWLAGIS